MSRRAREKAVVGWREWVTLPELLDTPIKAKLDTGARTSSLHAFRLQELDGGATVRFEIHPRQRTRAESIVVECPIVDRRRVRSSNGQVQERPVIRTVLRMGGTNHPIDLTLTNRDEMGFRMLIGRRALRGRYLVDPGRSYLNGAAP